MAKRKTKKKAARKARQFDAKAARERLRRLIAVGAVEPDPWGHVRNTAYGLIDRHMRERDPLSAIQVAELAFFAHQAGVVDAARASGLVHESDLPEAP